MDIENLVPLVSGGLDKLATPDVFDARLKIYGILQLAGPKQLVDICLKLDFEVVLIDLDAVDDEPQVVAVELFLGEDVPKNIHGGFRHAVDPQDGVAPVREQVDLVSQPLDPALEIAFHLVVGFLQQRLLIGVLHDVADALALGGLELLVQVVQHRSEVVGGLFGFGDVFRLGGKVLIQPLDHGGRAFHHAPDIQLDQLVQPVRADVVAGAARRAPAVIGAAGVGGGQVAAAHGKHRASAVTALEEAGVDVVVLLDAAVVGAGAAFAQRARGGKGAVVDDGLVVVFDDDVLAFVPRHVLAVDLDAGGLALTECADVEVIVEDALHGHDRPRALGRAAGFLAGGLPAHLLGHARRGDALRGQKIGDFLVSPAIVVVVVKDAAHDVRFGRHHFKFLALVDGVAVGRGADPFSVYLPPADDVSHLFAGIGDGHFVDEKLKLDF